MKNNAAKKNVIFIILQCFFTSFNSKYLLGGDDTDKQFFRGCPLGVVVFESVKQEVKRNCLSKYNSIWHHRWQSNGKVWNSDVHLPCTSARSNTPSILLFLLWVCSILGDCQTILWLLVLSAEMLSNSFLNNCINHKKCSFDKTENCYSADFPILLLSHTSLVTTMLQDIASIS